MPPGKLVENHDGGDDNQQIIISGESQYDISTHCCKQGIQYKNTGKAP